MDAACQTIFSCQLSVALTKLSLQRGVQVYGEDVAILAGDALLAYAFEYIARETQGVAPEHIVRVRAAHWLALVRAISASMVAKILRAAWRKDTM